MNAGRIEQLGTPQEVYYRPASEFVARFFGDNNLIDGTLRRGRRRAGAIETPIGSVPSAPSTAQPEIAAAPAAGHAASSGRKPIR